MTKYKFRILFKNPGNVFKVISDWDIHRIMELLLETVETSELFSRVFPDSHRVELGYFRDYERGSQQGPIARCNYFGFQPHM